MPLETEVMFKFGLGVILALVTVVVSVTVMFPDGGVSDPEIETLETFALGVGRKLEAVEFRGVAVVLVLNSVDERLYLPLRPPSELVNCGPVELADEFALGEGAPLETVGIVVRSAMGAGKELKTAAVVRLAEGTTAPVEAILEGAVVVPFSVDGFNPVLTVEEGIEKLPVRGASELEISGPVKLVVEFLLGVGP